MRNETTQTLAGLFEPPPRMTPWEWAREHVDFSLNPAYPTEFKGHYDPEFLPFWKEPAENVFDGNIREQAILKCSQAGGTENVCLNSLRYAVAVAPRRCLYVWGDQKAAEDDFRERIVGGLSCGMATSRKLDLARNVECRLDFPDMAIVGAWPKNKMAFKRNPWSLIMCDEFSTYPNLTPDMIRKRCDTVPFSHIVWISSPDPTMKQSSDDDPIFVEFKQGDQREWMVPDPKTGALFRFEMGGPDCPFGLKWSEDCRREDGQWDLEKVRASAYYLTPDGTRIENDDRMALVRRGQWVPTNPDAPSWRRSYHVNSFMMPFDSGDFGTIACAFLRAKRSGTHALRVFVYEYMAEPWMEGVEKADDAVLYARQRKYKKGQRMSESEKYRDEAKEKGVGLFLTADVQKGHHWYVLREWYDGGTSALVDWGYGVLIEDLRKVDEAHKVDQVFIDNRYAERRMEVYQACMEFAWVPTIGADSRLALPFRKQVINPYEGKLGGMQRQDSITQVTFDTDIFKTLLLDMVNGKAPQPWFVYDKIESEYVRQVASEERVDGTWKQKRGHPNNHLWDCEVLQLLAATVEKLYRNEYLEEGA